MKKTISRKYLPWGVLAAGFVGCFLRLWLMGTETDRGFVDKFHISAFLLLALTAAVLLFLYAATHSLQQGSKYSFNFPASAIGAAGAFAAAAGMGISSGMRLLAATDLLCVGAAAMGIISSLCLIFAGHCRHKGLHPNILPHAAICLGLMLQLICGYRQWSADPQLYDYCYQLLALACAMVAVYQRAAFNADFGKRHSYAFFNLATVYFCLICLSSSDWLYYLALGCWLFTDLCDLTPLPKEFREEAQ